MKATLHALSFVLVCLVAYYMAIVSQMKEELSVEKHSEGSHSSQEDHSPSPAPVEEPEEPVESLQDAENVPDQDAANVPDQDVANAPGQDVENAPGQDVENAPGQDVENAPGQDGTNVLDQDGTNALGAAPAEVPEAQEEETQQPHPLARGWGEDIDWVETYEEALRMSKTSKKPLMIIHHRESCPICKDLKAAFSGHEEIQRMAKEEFVMFNLMHETKDSNLAPDGYYVPRIIFVDPAMVVRSDITRAGKKYMYSYTDNDMQQLLDNMKTAKISLNLPEL